MDCPKNRIAFFIALAGVLTGILAGAFFSLTHDLPQINALKQFKPPAVSNVYAADQRIFTRFFIEKRLPVSLNQIPGLLIDAVITTEDRRFFEHGGIDLKSVSRAILSDVIAGRFKQGGSTLSQQLAKTLFLTSEKSITRKIKEALLTFQIERRYTKNEILELYLNQIYFGSGAYGIQAAAMTYFKKDIRDINLAEAALLAGLPKAPSRYSPLSHPDRAIGRRNMILSQMLSQKKINQDEYHAAIRENYQPPEADSISDPAPFFTDYIKDSLAHHFSMDTVYTRGLNIYTTLDLTLQNSGQNSMINHLTQLEKRMTSAGISNPHPEAALIAIDIRSGGILSMIGGRNYIKSSFNRAVYARRQPGSAFKPFVYGCAIENGLTQQTSILDAPLSVSMPGRDNVWSVNNFSGTFSGEMTIRKALALSKNTPAIRLIQMLTPQAVVDFAYRLGISSRLEPNLSLALGTSEVTLIELCAAYGVFANSGIWTEPYGIQKITDADGVLLYKANPLKKAVMSRINAAIVTDMLKAAILEGTGKKAGIIAKEIAGKTGTTNDYKDALFIGFSRDIVIGIWIGNDDATTLGNNETGARAALPVWIDYMTEFLKGKPYQFFDIPDGIEMIYMDPDSGKVVEKNTSQAVKALVKTKERS